MIDVFVKIWASSRMRSLMAGAVLERLEMFEDARVRVLFSSATSNIAAKWPRQKFDVISAGHFWITTKEFADRAATSDIYVVIDDDHLPIGKNWLVDGVSALEAHPDFAMLASWSVNGEIHPPASAWSDEDVWEEQVRSIGTPYFCRRQSLRELPDGPLGSYDQVLSDHVRANIGRIGFLKNVRHNHLGYGYSQVIPEHWGA